MQFPVTLRLHRSSILGVLIALLAVVSALALVFSGLGLWVSLGGGAVWWISLGLAWYYRQPREVILRLHGDGGLGWVGEGGERPVAVLPGSLAHPYLSVLRLKDEGRYLSLIVMPDSLPKEDFRHLRLWLRWKRVTDPHEDAV